MDLAPLGRWNYLFAGEIVGKYGCQEKFRLVLPKMARRPAL
jgi:hypothetical protein